VSKVKITTWVDERIASTIEGLVAQQGVSVSELCAELFRRGVEEDAGGEIPRRNNHKHLDALVVPRLPEFAVPVE